MDITAEELNSAIIRRYLRVFETEDIAELRELVDEDVIAHGAGHTVQGRHWVEDSVHIPGLSDCRMGIEDFFAARDRVTVAFTMTYKQDRTGRDLVVSGLKSYRLRDGRIVELWGETDVFGLLRQAGLIPDSFEMRRTASDLPGRTCHSARTTTAGEAALCYRKLKR